MIAKENNANDGTEGSENNTNENDEDDTVAIKHTSEYF